MDEIRTAVHDWTNVEALGHGSSFFFLSTFPFPFTLSLSLSLSLHFSPFPFTGEYHPSP
jgi:hypothetical protein